MQAQKTSTDPIGSAVGSSCRPRLSPTEITWLVACCARIPTVFLAARFRLSTTMFTLSESKFILLWRAITAAADDNKGVLPGDAKTAKEIIALKCAKEIAGDTSKTYFTSIVEQDVLGPSGLLEEMFLLPVGPEVETQGLSLLASFVTERLISDPLRKALAGVGPDNSVSDPSSVLAAIEKHARDIAGISIDPGRSAVIDTDDFLPPGPKLFTTKLGWLDNILGGGQAQQECYVLLGPTGGGKTAAGIQLATEGAELQAAIASELGPDEAGFWYYFTYELSEDQIRPRVYQYGAKLHFNTIRDRLPLSTSEKPETIRPYEYDSYINSPGNPLMGERERVAALRKRMSGPNDRLRIIDYSGTHAGQGVGGVEEISTYLKREIANGRRPKGIVIDYAGLCVSRLISARRLKPDAVYQLLESFVDTVRNQISVPMKCAAWVLHQLHGSATKKSPGSQVHHSEARGCRNFADNSDFGLQLTPYNKTTGLLTIHCTKHRRAPGIEDGTIIRFRGEYGAFISPDQEYEIDPSTHQIVPRGFGDMLIKPTVRTANKPVDPRLSM